MTHDRRTQLRTIAERNGSTLPRDTPFTCDYCPLNGWCCFAWQDENINGDCLAEQE